ncbi:MULTISPECIES: DMT family transporter [unclassified Polaromonas]|uniref:DMT family transporter n=1 Tax=unclassified Polaromonas TaxID=2638319 RepID=UPI0025E1305F|nr:MULTISPECIES: DMT family transporter [unclassified Polaromonas]HQR97768.1 DMT family transporter [Polaromonas sp.]HQS40915.1 DMT family transporter [Polaromonas sp.]HQS86203.1 DMT family transporter [Polaromonas sp.]HQT07980.1 DMT family transporter [Polaromonas sp.]
MKLNLALLAAAATGVQVGAAIVASRFVVADVPPLTLALLRYAIGFACLLPFFLKSFLAPALGGQARAAIKNIAISDWLAMAGLGTGQFAVLIALLNYGLQHIGAAQAALIFSLFPLLTLLLSSALGRERISAALLAGVLLSITGVALSLWPKLQAPHPGHWWGEAAVLASAGVGALCSVLYRPYLQRYPTLAVSSFAMLVSVLFLGLLALTENWPTRVMALGLQSWTVVALIGISSGIGYFWWLYALKHESPTRVTVFLALNPLTAALLGVLFLGEALSPWSAAAIFLIASGLWLATRGAAPARR